MPSAAMFAFAVCSVTDSRRYACWRNCCGEYSFEWSESNLSSATDSGAMPPCDSTANAVNLYSFTALIAAYFECFSLTALRVQSVSYTHLRAHETDSYLV